MLELYFTVIKLTERLPVCRQRRKLWHYGVPFRWLFIKIQLRISRRLNL